eukprot:jgi/Mesvir1/28624/Mv04495-RA.1
MSAIKPLTPAWIYARWDRCRSEPEVMKRGFEKAGLSRAWTTAFQREAMRLKEQGKIFPNDTTMQEAPQGEEADLTAEEENALVLETEADAELLTDIINDNNTLSTGH